MIMLVNLNELVVEQYLVAEAAMRRFSAIRFNFQSCFAKFLSVKKWTTKGKRSYVLSAKTGKLKLVWFRLRRLSSFVRKGGSIKLE